MRIVVPIKAVPDLVEEIELTPDETGIDREFLKFVVSEWDAQALEEALLVKDASGAEVVAVGLASDPDIDQALYTAIAKGADGAVKITGGDEDSALTGDRAALLAGYLAAEPADLVITGVQAADDVDGQLPPMLAAHLGQPHVSVVVAVEAADGGVTVRQEFAGGRVHELAVRLARRDRRAGGQAGAPVRPDHQDQAGDAGRRAARGRRRPGGQRPGACGAPHVPAGADQPRADADRQCRRRGGRDRGPAPRPRPGEGVRAR